MMGILKAIGKIILYSSIAYYAARGCSDSLMAESDLEKKVNYEVEAYATSERKSF